MTYLIRACFLISFCLMAMNVTNADICDLCYCGGDDDSVFGEYRNEKFLQIKCSAETLVERINVDLENIQWPTINVSLVAHFNYMKFTDLPRLLGSTTVKLINLDHNLIEAIKSDPFRQCTNLESLSIANNSIFDLPKDFLKSTTFLRHLNLSHNLLSDIDSGVLSHLTKLRSVDLSYNKLKTLSIEIINMLDNVETLNLKGNEIIFVQSAARQTLPRLKNLNLANNRLALVEITTFQYFQDLEELDISHNSIEVIESEAFTNLTKLKFLDVSNNDLRQLSLILPNYLQHLIISSNHIKTWPLTNFPRTLTHLEIQHNQLIELFSTKWFSNNLKIFNASHNLIEFLPNVDYPELEILDLSFNSFTEVPQNLGAKAKKLDTLILDHNPIESVEFEEPIYLRRLSMRNMSLLRNLDETSLRNVDGQGDCMEIIISGCEKLSHIHVNALMNLDVCNLDLSYNNLKTIPESLTNWTKLTQGIDIQGNPFECNCSEQWMLDVILHQLYLNESQQHLLYNLKNTRGKSNFTIDQWDVQQSRLPRICVKCAGPEQFKDHRFVKYYKKRAAFCNPNSAMRMAPYRIELSSFGQSSGNIHLSLTAGPGFIIVIILSAICLILLVIVGFMWKKQQREKLERYRRYQYFECEYE